MGYSIIIALPPAWDLASISRCLQACAHLHPDSILVFEEQIEVGPPAKTSVVIEEMPDRDPMTGYENKEELLSDPELDEQFRRDLAGLRLFTADFNDIEAVRPVLRCIMEKVVSAGDTAWLDTTRGTSARAFLAKTDQDPQWDWRNDAEES